MRNEAPRVFDWLSRVWNAHETAGRPEFVSEVPGAAAPMLKEASETHLVQLRENALAFGNDQSHVDMSVQGCRYQKLPLSRYRVYCLEQLREGFAALSKEDQSAARGLLPYPDSEVLWQVEETARSGYDEARQAPFNMAINVYGDGVPQ